MVGASDLGFGSDVGSDLDLDSDSDSDSDADIVLVESPDDWRFDKVDVRAFKLRLDYRPKRVDLRGLVSGDRMALVNLLAFEGLEVALGRVELCDVRGGWQEVTQRLQETWAKDVGRQRHRCLAGVSFPPVNKVAALGSGLTNLVLMPLEQYQKDGRVVHGVRRGAASLLRTVAIEALGTFSKAAQTAQTLLEHARDVIALAPAPGVGVGSALALGPPPPGRAGAGAGGLVLSGTMLPDGSPLSRVATAGAGGGARAGEEGGEGGGGPGDGETNQPRNVSEGLERAADSLTREVKRAAFVLVALPLGEFQRAGATAAVKTALRGVPVAVIRPLIGATQAMSNTLIGMRNTVDVDSQIEDHQKFKYKPPVHP